MGESTYRRYGTAILLVALVALAGCSGAFQPGDAPEGNNTTEMSETPASTTSPMETNATDGNQTSHTANETDAAMSGRMLLIVDGQDTHVDGVVNESADAWVNESHPHTWHVANESTTLASALTAFDINATADSVSYAGETYTDSTNGTSVAYRVDGTVVEDPTTYQLEDGDQVFVTVHPGNLTTPGREYSQAHPHPHGTLEATIEGEEVNFSRERYTMNDETFHFHGDENADRWHAHSMNLTASYALSTFAGFNVTNDSVTYNGTTYDADATTITVNGEPIDPDTYVLKDGDDVRLVVDETG